MRLCFCFLCRVKTILSVLSWWRHDGGLLWDQLLKYLMIIFLSVWSNKWIIYAGLEGQTQGMSFLDLWIWGRSGVVLRSGGGINSKRRRSGLTLTVTEMWFVSLMFGCLLPPPRPPLCISLPAVASDTLDQTDQTRRQIRPNPRKKT